LLPSDPGGTKKASAAIGAGCGRLFDPVLCPLTPHAVTSWRWLARPWRARSAQPTSAPARSGSCPGPGLF
jgi:hypothetical protein